MLSLRDVTTRRRRERELERMAYTDHLTGLPNRAMLFRELDADPAPGVPAPRCLLVLDLDGFKTVNDVAGHEAGDQLLIEVARRLHTVVRDDDLVARLGGDEFAVLLGGTLEEAVDIAQRVVDALALPHRSGEWAFAVGASIGVTVLRDAGGQLAFREADSALRVAKQAGKGCVRVAGEGPRGNTAGPDVADALAGGSLELRYEAATGDRRAGRPCCPPSPGGSTACWAPFPRTSCGPPRSGRAAPPTWPAGSCARPAPRSRRWTTSCPSSWHSRRDTGRPRASRTRSPPP